MQTLPKRRQPGNGILSEDTTIAILETFMRVHGPSSEQQLTAVLQAAAEAVTALWCFEMVMRGDLVAELAPGGTVFHTAESKTNALEPVAPIVRLVAAEVGA